MGDTSSNTNTIGQVYDDDILRPILFLDGKRIQKNIKKHKREDKRNHNKRPNKRRKLSKNKKNLELTEAEIEEEGEDDTYGGLPYHIHLATHCEPKFNQMQLVSDEYTDIKTLLHPNSDSVQIKSSNTNTNTLPCKLQRIQYKKENFLSLAMDENDEIFTKQLIANYDQLLIASQHKTKDFEI